MDFSFGHFISRLFTLNFNQYLELSPFLWFTYELSDGLFRLLADVRARTSFIAVIEAKY